MVNTLENLAMTHEIQFGRTDGVTTFITSIAPALIQQGVRFTLFAPSAQTETNKKVSGMRIENTAGIALPGYAGVKLAVPTPDFFRSLSSLSPDLVHALAPASLGLGALLWASFNNVPRIASYNTRIPDYWKYYHVGFLEEISWFFYTFVHNRAQLNLAPSESVKQQMIKHRIRNVELLGRGIDTEHFNPNKRSLEWRRRLTNGLSDKPIILYVGRMAREKNLESLWSIINSSPQLQFVFVGEGPRLGHLKKLFNSSNVIFTGPLYGEDLAAAYASSDIFVFPSLTEGMPNVVGEAMASGLPVIGYETFGVEELIYKSQAGILAPANDLAQLAKNLRMLVDNPVLSAQLAKKGRSFALTKTWKNISLELQRYYDTVLKNRKGFEITKYPVVEIAHLIDQLANLFYRMGMATRPSPAGGSVINPLRIERTLGSRMFRARLYYRLMDYRRIDMYPDKMRTARIYDEFDRQFLHQSPLEIDLGPLGKQMAYYVDVNLNQDKMNSQPTVFIIGGHSGDLHGALPLVKSFAINGRRVIAVGYPESYLGQTTENFAQAVEQRNDYSAHSEFFKATIAKLCGNSEIVLCGYSTGGPIVAEILNDPHFSKRVTDAIAFAPASSVDQTYEDLKKGIKNEIWYQIRHFNEFPYISEVIGLKREFVSRWEAKAHRKLRKRISEALIRKATRKTTVWQSARVNQGHIMIVNFESDKITKSDEAYKRGVFKDINPQLYVETIRGSHLAPLTFGWDVARHPLAQLAWLNKHRKQS